MKHGIEGVRYKVARQGKDKERVEAKTGGNGSCTNVQKN